MHSVHNNAFNKQYSQFHIAGPARLFKKKHTHTHAYKASYRSHNTSDNVKQQNRFNFRCISKWSDRITRQHFLLFHF